jgi:hypothetical protein
VQDVKKKINALRMNFRKEKIKIERSERSGAGTDDIYIIQLAGQSMSLIFLMKFET